MKKVTIAALFAACSLTANATSLAPNHQALTVDFYSLGGGINTNLYKKVKEVLSNEFKKGNFSFYQEMTVGHEGERYICLDNDRHSTDAIFAKLNSFKKPNDLVTMQQHHVRCTELDLF